MPSPSRQRGESPLPVEPDGKTIREGGVELISALQVGIIRALFVRFDLRLHRKVVVIDGMIGYTGSFNLVDPRYFKKSAGVGEWIDAMVRVQGPVVEALAVSFISDWVVESHESVTALAEETIKLDLMNVGNAPVQVLPSGPTSIAQAIEQVVIQALYAARQDLVISTPYFVPDETLVAALVTAAHRGINITLILPEKVDSKLTGLAGQAFIGDLLEAGIHVALFRGGLLHTKSITVDNDLSLFGSLNLDPLAFISISRSPWQSMTRSSRAVFANCNNDTSITPCERPFPIGKGDRDFANSRTTPPVCSVLSCNEIDTPWEKNDCFDHGVSLGKCSST